MFPILAGSNPSGYNLTRSLRFRSSATAYLNRTPASAGNRKTWTWSAWVKRGTLGSNQVVFISKPSGTNDATFTDIAFSSSNTLLISGYSVQWRNTTQVFRDPSAWYHIVVTWDTTQATASNRVRVYVNGSQVTAFGTTFDPPLNFDGAINQADVHAFCAADGYSYGYFDGYLTEVNFIDGQALTPSSFGSTNTLTGVWQPARYTSTYGTNGFYLPFTDNSALTTSSNVGLGKDFSGNGNYWTTNNISITSGVTYDSMTDVPTLTSATAANFAVVNPLANVGGLPISAGNLNVTGNGSAGGTYGRTVGTMAVSSGKWYWEYVLNSTNGYYLLCGIALSSEFTGNYVGSTATSYGYYGGTGVKYNNGSSAAYGAAYGVNDIIGVALDLDAGTLTFYKNNVSQGTAYSGLSGSYVPAFSFDTGAMTGGYSVNFGQRPFAYTPPTGFVALNTFNLPTSTIVKGNTVMDATLYTGTLLSNAVTNAAGFKPDLVWVKSRSAATDNELTDSVRGVTKSLTSNSTAAEATDVQGLTAFNTNGFTVGTNTNYNNLAATYVGWQWQAGQSSSSSNTNGTITSTVSVNASAGFSVVTYTGTGANATVGHGLGVAPSLIIVKRRDSTANWNVYHASVGATGVLLLNLTDTTATTSVAWNNTAPTSSVFTVGTGNDVNASGGTFVAYCFASIAGFSSFANYTGNGSTDGVFVYTGFRPKFVMIKRTNVADDWYINDTIRDPINVTGLTLLADSSNAEANYSPTIDILSNGFKVRQSGAGYNASGGNYVYTCWAETPFKNSLAR
jgi:hypothetical protein